MSYPVSKRFFPETALGFADVMIQPAVSNVSPAQASLATQFSTGIALKTPFMTVCRDIETSFDTAVSFSRIGGIAIIPHDMPVSRQADLVRRIKRHQCHVVRHVLSVTPETYVAEAMEYRQRHGVDCVPLIDPATGIVSKMIPLDDAFMALEPDGVIGDLGLGIEPITISENAIDQADALLLATGADYLVVIGDCQQCVGLISKSDRDNIAAHPDATMDGEGRLRIAASVCTGEDHLDRVSALIDAGVDAIVVDTVHAHTKAATDMVTFIRRQRSGHVDVVAGQVLTAEAALALIDAGANGIRVGSGADGVNGCLAPGVGMPQFSALLQVGEACAMHQVPMIADGGMMDDADFIKAFAAGAAIVNVADMMREGGDVKDEIKDLQGHLRCAMSYTGCATLKEFAIRTRFSILNR